MERCLCACDSLSCGSLSDSLSLQLVELYHPAIRNGMLMVTLLPVQQQEELETADSPALQMIIVLLWVRTLTTTKAQCGVTWNLEKEELSPFPPSSVPVKKSRLRHLFVKVYCFCKRLVTTT